MVRQVIFTNEMMRKYVQFLCANIPVNVGANIHNIVKGKDGKTWRVPIKAVTVPAKIEIVDRLSRSAIINITALGHTKNVHLFFSRHHGPETIFDMVQKKIDAALEEIMMENEMDRSIIIAENHFLRGIKLDEIKGIIQNPNPGENPIVP